MFCPSSISDIVQKLSRVCSLVSYIITFGKRASILMKYNPPPEFQWYSWDTVDGRRMFVNPVSFPAIPVCKKKKKPILESKLSKNILLYNATLYILIEVPVVTSFYGISLLNERVMLSGSALVLGGNPIFF